jgi:hypothetical protein
MLRLRLVPESFAAVGAVVVALKVALVYILLFRSHKGFKLM